MTKRVRNIVLMFIALCAVFFIMPSAHANEDIPIEVKIVYGTNDITLYETPNRIYLQAYNTSNIEGSVRYQFFPKIFQLQSLYETFIIEDMNTGEIVYKKVGHTPILIDGYNYPDDETIRITSDGDTVTLEESIDFRMYFVKEAEYTKPASNLILTVDVSNPIDIDEINSLFGAWDNYYGNVSSSIIIISDEYSENMHQTGLYKIELEARDGSDNVTRFTYSILVNDDESPVVEPLEDIIISYKETIDIESLLERVVATDNYTENLEISINDENYTEKANEVGEYFVEIMVDDLNSNAVLIRQKIIVIDDVAPVITGPGKWAIKVEEFFRPNDFISSLVATDEIDTDPIKLYIISSDYVRHEVGEFTILVGAKDKYGNEATKIVTMTVYDDIAPEFYVKIPQINVVANQMYSVEDLLGLIENKLTIQYESIEIIQNNYLGNEDTPGVYLVTLSATVGNEKINIQTQVRVEEAPPIVSVVDDVKTHQKWIYYSVGLTSLICISLGLYYIYRRKKSNKLK